MVTRKDWKGLLKEGKNKFRFNPKRIFTTQGQEISEKEFVEETEVVKEVFENSKLGFVFSEGKDFVGVKMEKKENPNAPIGFFFDLISRSHRLNTLKGTFEKEEKFSKTSVNDSEEMKEEKEEKEDKTDISSSSDCIVKILAKSSYIEPDAIKQLNSTSKLPNMKYAIGFKINFLYFEILVF